MTYFADEELSCPCCGKLKLANGFGEHLLALREEFGRPMVINSACRCVNHNKAVGGKIGSFHRIDNHVSDGCCAVDVKCPDGKYYGDLFALAWSKGWSVGRGKGFLHIDRRVDYGQPQTSFSY